MVSPEPGAPVRALDGTAWAKIGILMLLVAAFYSQEILKLVNQWRADPDWSHGFLIPLFSLFLLYSWRRQILSVDRQVSCLWGSAIILLAVAVKAYAILLLKNNWITELTIPLLIFGVVVYLCGLRMGRLTFVPIFFLALAMPWPEALYGKIALQLQNLAAMISTKILVLFGQEVTVSASNMQVTSVSGKTYPLTVAEACSGMRSLMAFFALGVAMAYVEERPLWQRLTIILAGIPIAIVVNILRVTATSTMYIIDQPELGQDFMHTAMGMVLLIPALLLLFLLTRFLDKLYVEEDEEDEEQPPEPSPEEEGNPSAATEENA